MKKVIIFCILFICKEAHGQKLGLDVFARLPQVVNYNFTRRHVSYTPIISAGFTLRHKSLFADIGSFIDKGDVYGHYTYFGSSLYKNHYSENKLLVMNCFGEVAYIPGQEGSKELIVKTIGVSPVIVWPIQNSAFAVALTLGVAFSNSATSLNSRIILNYALPIFK